MLLHHSNSRILDALFNKQIVLSYYLRFAPPEVIDSDIRDAMDCWSKEWWDDSGREQYAEFWTRVEEDWDNLLESHKQNGRFGWNRLMRVLYWEILRVRFEELGNE